MGWTPGTPTPGGHRAQGTVQALEQRVAALEQALKVTSNGMNVELTTQGTLKIKAGATVIIEGAAIVEVKGAMLKLNGGSRPVARIGDTVAGNAIAGPGNPTIMG